jgi:hypothetical protein
MQTKTLVRVTGIALACLALPVGAMLVGGMLFDVSDARPGSLGYYLGVPSSIRSASATFDECRPARFRWKGRDGEGVPFVTMHYGSRLEPAEAIRRHTEALSPLACRSASTGTGATEGALMGGRLLHCLHADVLEADIHVEHAGPCREVSIGFVLND